MGAGLSKQRTRCLDANRERSCGGLSDDKSSYVRWTSYILVGVYKEKMSQSCCNMGIEAHGRGLFWQRDDKVVWQAGTVGVYKINKPRSFCKIWSEAHGRGRG